MSCAPFVGDALASSEVETSRFVSTVGSQLEGVAFAAGQQVTTEAVVQQLSNALGVSPDAIIVSGQDGDSDIRFTVSLTGNSEAQVDLDLVGADPTLELKLGGENAVDLDVTWTYELTFGVREDAQGVSEFYIDSSAADEVAIDYTATLRSDFADGKGRVGVFVADIDASDVVSVFEGEYVLDVAGDAEAPQVTGALSGEGDAYLDIDAAFFPTFLEHQSDALINLAVTAQAQVTYDTELGFDSQGELTATNNTVAVAMNDVTLDLGSVYRDFIDPLIGNLQDNLRPVKPVVDFLTAPLPVISDLSVLAGYGEITALSSAPASVQKAVRGLDAILDYTGLNQTEAGEENQFSFRVESSGVDPRTAADRQAAIEANLQKVQEEGFFLRLNDKHQEGADESWKSQLSWKTAFEGAIDVPFLTDPQVLAGFLLGDENSDFFTFDVDASIDFGLQVNIPIAPLLNFVSVTGGIGFEGQFNLGGGYDAAGLQRLSQAADFSSETALRASLESQQDLLLHGFYLDDHNADANTNQEGGANDEFEVQLTTTVTAGVEANLDLVLLQFTAGGNAFLDGNLDFDLNDLPDPASWNGGTPIWSNVRPGQASDADWNYDGKVRLHELTTIIDADPRSLVNTSGSLEAGLDAHVEFGVLGFTVFKDEFELARMTLVSGRTQPNDGEVIWGDAPQLGSISDTGGADAVHGRDGESPSERGQSERSGRVLRHSLTGAITPWRRDADGDLRTRRAGIHTVL